jgi:hypothetical protein
VLRKLFKTNKTQLHTCKEDDNSILAFSAASLNLCNAMLSFVMSIPCCRISRHFDTLRKQVIVVYNTNSVIFQVYHGENKLHFNEMMMYALY